MLADFFTKPLQGSLFKKFRDVLMGYKHISTLVMPTKQPSEERVGDNLLSDDSLGHAGTKKDMSRVTNNKKEGKPLSGSRKPLTLAPNGRARGTEK
jgi:hypothetical protein